MVCSIRRLLHILHHFLLILHRRRNLLRILHNIIILQAMGNHLHSLRPLMDSITTRLPPTLRLLNLILRNIHDRPTQGQRKNMAQAQGYRKVTLLIRTRDKTTRGLLHHGQLTAELTHKGLPTARNAILSGHSRHTEPLPRRLQSLKRPR